MEAVGVVCVPMTMGEESISKCLNPCGNRIKNVCLRITLWKH